VSVPDIVLDYVSARLKQGEPAKPVPLWRRLLRRPARKEREAA
jgi:hypothetical protein